MICKRVAVLMFMVSAVLQSFALKYESSKTYTYYYTTDVLLNDVNSKKSTPPQQDVGVQIALDFQLSTVYKDSKTQLFKLLIHKAQMTSVLHPETQKELKGILSFPVYFLLSGDMVDRLHFAASDTAFSKNVKKGIISLFQVQEKEGSRTEVDVSGECQVAYNSPQPGIINRVLSDCQNLEIAGQYTTLNKALGISEWKQTSQHYNLQNSVINSVNGSQHIITYVNMRSALNGGITSRQTLQLVSTSEGVAQFNSVEDALEAAEKDNGLKFVVSLLPSEEEVLQCTDGCETPKSLIPKLAKDLDVDNLATIKSAKAFTEILKVFRNAGKHTLSEAFILKDSYYIVPQLLDVATATQTEASRQALLELVNFEDTDAIEYPQRFLFAAAYSSHPSEEFIADLLALLEKPIPNQSLKNSLMLSLGAIVHTFCQIEEQCRSQVVVKFEKLLLNSLSACKDSFCKLMYLRALGNAGLPGSVATIIQFAEMPKESMVAFTAIQALRRIPDRFISQKVLTSLEGIFHQTLSPYDSSVRAASLEVLLQRNPSVQLVRDVLRSCLDQSNGELSTYFFKMLLDSATASLQVREALILALQDPTVHNYNVWSQAGKSSVITSFLAKMKDVNASYNLFFENSPSGVMKKSGMVVSLLSQYFNQPFMKFGIYADGLESLMGEGGEEGEEGEDSTVEPTAGLAFNLMDVLLTEVEFFRGTSGLMSAVWSAPSELTSALQGNILLQDHSKRYHLLNGLIVDSQVLGTLSMDLSGLVSISLWNRNCEALIRSSGALYLEGSLQIASEEISLSYQFSGEGQSYIDFTSNADFYEMPVKLCMQMKRPEFEFIQRIKKTEKIDGFRRYKSKVNVKTSVAGESYFLNKVNSEECRIMITDE